MLPNVSVVNEQYITNVGTMVRMSVYCLTYLLMGI